MFIYSLPILFTEAGLATPIELLIIFLAVFMVLFFMSPVPEKTFQTSPLQNYLFAAWTGQASLNLAFWPFFVILNVCLYGIDTLAKTGNFTVSSWDEAHLILLLPTLWWTVSTWRCSACTHSRLWGAFARLMTFSVFFEYGLKLLIRIDYPRLFFNCEEVLLDYGSCF